VKASYLPTTLNRLPGFRVLRHLLSESISVPRLTQAGIETLQGYDWPGNIRELRNVIERAVIIAGGGALEFDLPVTGSSVDLTYFGPQDDEAPEVEYLTESENATPREGEPPCCSAKDRLEN